MEKILQQIADFLTKSKRPELVNAKVYGQYSSKEETFLYDDKLQSYEKHSSKPEQKQVRSIKAFCELIKEELKRRNNPTGEKATVKIDLFGGTFYPDDDFGTGETSFKRLNSQQWYVIKNGINKTYDHKSFLMFVQELKPSIENFREIFQQFATLRMVGRTEITSNPIFTENGQDSGYKCTYKLEDGTDGEEHFPSGFIVKCPFAKAGDFSYVIPVDLLFYRDSENELKIEVLCPLFENIEEEAIIDESNFVKQECQNISDLLILSDF